MSGKRVVFLVANEGVEQVELTSPWRAVQEAGGQPVLAAPKAGDVQAFNHLDKAELFQATMETAQLQAEEFDGVVLPGGVANPDQLRMDEAGGALPAAVDGSGQAGGRDLPCPVVAGRGGRRPRQDAD
jgi:protease I